MRSCVKIITVLAAMLCIVLQPAMAQEINADIASGLCSPDFTNPIIVANPIRPPARIVGILSRRKRHERSGEKKKDFRSIGTSVHSHTNRFKDKESLNARE